MIRFLSYCKLIQERILNRTVLLTHYVIIIWYQKEHKFIYTEHLQMAESRKESPRYGDRKPESYLAEGEESHRFYRPRQGNTHLLERRYPQGKRYRQDL